MPLPRWVARFNKRFTNRLIEPIVARFAGFAIVEHRGRRSGTGYRTPVNVFEADGDLIVALTYGPAADWVQNVLAGGGAIVRASQRYQVAEARIVGRTEAWPHLPVPIRCALRLLTVHHFCRMRAVPLASQ